MTSTNVNQSPWPSDAPRNRLIIRSSSLVKSSSNLSSFVSSHHFNRSLDIIIPKDMENIKEVIEEWQAKGKDDFFYVATFPFDYLLDPSFLDEYVRPNDSKLYALQHDSPIDQTSCIAITPGKLVMSVTEDLYSQLGIQGSKETYSGNKSTGPPKFRISVDIANSTFRPGNKLYDRVLWCFKERVAPITFIVSYYKSGKCEKVKWGTNVSASRLGLQMNAEALEMIPTPKFSKETNTFVSEGLINASEKEGEENGILKEFLLWNGFIVSGMAGFVQPKEDSFESVLSQFRSGLQMETVSCTILRLKGMLSPYLILHITNQIHQFVSNDSTIPWASVSVKGFQDAPLSFGNCIHSTMGYHGENDYLLAFLSRDILWQFVTLGVQDQYS